MPRAATKHDRQAALPGRGLSKGAQAARVMNVGNAHGARAALARQTHRFLCGKAHGWNAKALAPQHQGRAAVSSG